MAKFDHHIRYQLINYLSVVGNRLPFIKAVIYDNVGPINVLIHKSIEHQHKKILALPLKYYSNSCDSNRTIYYLPEENFHREFLMKEILPRTTNITKSMFDLDDIDRVIMGHAIEQDFISRSGPYNHDVCRITLNIAYNFANADLYVFNRAAEAYLNGQEYDDIPDVLKATGWEKLK